MLARFLSGVIFPAAAAIFFLALSADEASAVCACRCVNGKNVPLCTSALDYPPFCPATACPMAPSPPIPLPVIPPPGRQACSLQHVLNPVTHMYELRQVCQ
jgi:hypothetical protein